MTLIASLISALVSQAAEETTERAAYRAANRPAYGVTDRATNSVAMVGTTALAAPAFTAPILAAETLCRQILRAALAAHLTGRRFWPFLILGQCRERCGKDGECRRNKHNARR
jgi:hypothetical protein